MRIDRSKRELSVPVIIIVIDIFPPIVHRQKFCKLNMTIPLPVFHKVGDQHRQSHQLIDCSAI